MASTALTTPAPTKKSVGAGSASPRRGRATLASGPSFWYTAPALVFFIGFAIIPLIIVLGLSFTNWDGLSEITPAGLDNWIAALTDPQTYQSLGITLQMMILGWIVQTPLAILIGVFTAGRQKYRAVYAVLFFVPLLISAAAIAIAWKALLDPNFGLGASTGIDWLSQNWLGNPDTALYVVVVIIAWQFIPFHALLYQGGVQQIPASMFEAATLDGAGRVQQFFSITLPQLEEHLHHVDDAHVGGLSHLLRHRLRADPGRPRNIDAHAPTSDVLHGLLELQHGCGERSRRHPGRVRARPFPWPDEAVGLLKDDQ